MRKRALMMEWHIAKDDADWAQLTVPPLDLVPLSNRLQRLKRILWRAAPLLLLATNVGGGIRHNEQVAFPHLAVDVTTTPQQEFRAILHDSEPVAASHSKDQSSLDWRHRQQVASTDDLWGPEYIVETRFFIYRFRQHDELAVSIVAAQSDVLYTNLRRNLGLGLPPSTEKQVIEVSMTQPPGYVIPLVDISDRFRVPSPAVYTASLELTDDQLLAQSIALQQIDHLLELASEHYQIKLAWYPMLNGLRLWQLWDMDLPLAAWKDEVVQWLYVDMPAVAPGQPLMLPDHYSELCAAHRLWMSSPLQLNIPFGCTSFDQEALLFPIWDPRDPLTHLNQLTVLMPPSVYLAGAGSLYSAHRPGQTIALATLIDYAVVIYGHERLPALMVGLGQYETWDTLLPAVFGVPTNEFEAGWQVYLTMHYGRATTPQLLP